MLLSSKQTTVVPGTRATRCAGSCAAGEHSTDSLYSAPGPSRPTASCSACGSSSNNKHSHSLRTAKNALAKVPKDVADVGRVHAYKGCLSVGLQCLTHDVRTKLGCLLKGFLKWLQR